VTEEKLAASLITWLTDQHWDVYQEVQAVGNEGRADIVAVIDKRCWVIETKMSLNLHGLAQAFAWNGMAHWVSLAIPHKSMRGIVGQFTSNVLERYGIGLLRLRTNGYGGESSTQWEVAREPDLLRRPLPYLWKAIEHHGHELKGNYAVAHHKVGTTRPSSGPRGRY